MDMKSVVYGVVGSGLLAAFFLGAVPARTAVARPAVDIENDIYVVLYKRRLEMSQALLTFKESKYRRNRLLNSKGVLSQEELEESQAEAWLFKAKVGEAQALVDIARARRENGLDMPILPTNQ